jgi:hypothetical protein
MKTAAEKVWNATVLAWSQAIWPSMAAGRVKTPAVPGYSRAEQDMAGAGEARVDCGMVGPRQGEAAQQATTRPSHRRKPNGKRLTRGKGGARLAQRVSGG